MECWRHPGYIPWIMVVCIHIIMCYPGNCCLNISIVHSSYALEKRPHWELDIRLDIVSWIHVSTRPDLLWQGEDEWTNPAESIHTILGFLTLAWIHCLCWDMQIWFMSWKAGIHPKWWSFQRMSVESKYCKMNLKKWTIHCDIMVDKWDNSLLWSENGHFDDDTHILRVCHQQDK